ncbi:MAG TPA: DUF4301 family protein [Syntrophales bacterium]|nr:DUF4301 family protein [Syntrophales bacterium]HOX94706.1 DUF4301 family protein [Syntrophales bacterium]HPI58123.1 DUF4301 family protein [Syntrophales bacterium]HPN24658.1 DUF4301 family protein [Syntrophales bacterium]HQM28963.1 DUF4301 family protein [Syntrophales bacterium]
MTAVSLSEEDLREILERGIGEGEVRRQIGIFERGVKPVLLERPATVGDGIIRVSAHEREELLALHERAAGDGRMLKFVPASGAASRMFKDWHGCHRSGRFDTIGQETSFLRDLPKFAFYGDLKDAAARDGRALETMIRDGKCSDILEYILTPKGLHYAWLPKALLKFHSYPGRHRTAMEEHLVEAALYVQDRKKICRIHFTVSGEHETRFREEIERVRDHYEEQFGVRYEIAVSIQHPSTDTIAVDQENRPFRDREGKILFRPGGHGALLRNLNAIDGDVIFLKNIDNVVPDRLKAPTVLYKKILGGYLVKLQSEIHRHLGRLAAGHAADGGLSDLVRFAREKLLLTVPGDFERLTPREREAFLFERLNRPLRVCGMVKNEGEPGGGPFWVRRDDGTADLQIIEEVQVDPESEAQRNIWLSSTHFNPVDLVCGVRDYRGRKFDLPSFVDWGAVSVSEKSHEGGVLKALELPGLWNGSMARWNTVFVEVPLETFNPVKTAEDLLRPSHLPA